MARADPLPRPELATRPEHARAGVLFALGAYGAWGVLPLYVRALGAVPPTQMVAHRICWSLLFVGVLLTAMRAWPEVRAVLRDRRTLGLLFASAALISANWLVYMWAVTHGHVLAGSLGYYLTPLINVALGTLVLKEKLSRAALGAVLLALAGVAALLVSALDTLWISLALATSFAAYGLVRKIAPVGAVPGLAIETALMLPVALPFLLTLGAAAAWGRDGGTDALLALSGAATAIPLLMYAAAAKRLRYATLGLMQFIAPTLQFLLAVTLFGEAFTTGHAIAFGCIWTAVAIYAADTLRTHRRERVARPT